MKKDKPSALKTLFQMAAMALAVMTGENQVSAQRSAGIAYDNFRSGSALRKLRAIFGGRASFAREVRNTKKSSAYKPERTPKTNPAAKSSPKFKRYTARRDV